jgi:hypothetical protein
LVEGGGKHGLRVGGDGGLGERNHHNP